MKGSEFKYFEPGDRTYALLIAENMTTALNTGNYVGINVLPADLYTSIMAATQSGNEVLIMNCGDAVNE